MDLRMPVDAALKIIMAQKDSEGIDIRWQRPERPVLCHGDLIRIEQVMVNLLANAVQAPSVAIQATIENLPVEQAKSGTLRTCP